MLKRKAKEEQFETSSITRQVKLKSKDEKNRMTDVVDIEGMFRLIKSIPSKKLNQLSYGLQNLEKKE